MANDIVGDHPQNLQATSLAVNAYLLTGEDRYLLAAEKGTEYLRERMRVLQWLFWQVGGLGPMAGQNHHFSKYAPARIPYAIERYRKETARLYGVLDRELAKGPYVAGDYSIAEIGRAHV